jgi:hypothetical protein
MGFLDRISSTTQGRTGTAGGFTVDKGERYGASFLLGMARGKTHDSSAVDKIAGIGGAVAVLGAVAMQRSLGILAPQIEATADACVADALCSWGARLGSARAQRVVAMVTPKPPTALKGWGDYVVGAIPPAKAGPFLTARQIADFAQRR